MIKSLYEKDNYSNLEKKQKLLQEGNILRNKTLISCSNIKMLLNKDSLATAVISNFIVNPPSELSGAKKKKFREIRVAFSLLPKLISTLRSCKWTCKPILLKVIFITIICGITCNRRKKKTKQ